MNKNEDKIKDVEPTTLGMDIFSEEVFYSEEINPTTAQFISLKAVYEKRAEKLKLKNDRYKDNTELRRGLAILFTITINGWLIIVFLILLNNKSLKLSDSVLIMLLGTTTIQVLGMMYVILKNLFPEKGKNDKPKPE